MKANSKTPNPAGKAGKPFNLSDYSFDDVVKKALSTPVPSKQAEKPKKKQQPTKKP